MAILVREYGLLFIMVPGTGCSVVGGQLRRELGGEWLPTEAERGKRKIDRKHNTIPQLLEHGFLRPEDLDRYVVFATVRNPFDHLVTYYQRLAGTWSSDVLIPFMKKDLERGREELTESEYEDRVRGIEARKARLSRRARLIGRVGFERWLMATSLRRRLSSLRTAKDSRRSGVTEHLFPMIEGVHVVMRQERLEEGLNEILRVAGVGRELTIEKRNVTPGKRPYSEYYSRTTRLMFEALFKDELREFGYGFEGPTDDRPLIWVDPRAKERLRAVGPPSIRA
ncbi:MAG: sulfotransferase family 2 domain-containing protein [Deltaproteobacteria bacterium]|nr:sulfotransferase family 2 domain-containing protein [Deltaproteobacteria bacterium]